MSTIDNRISALELELATLKARKNENCYKNHHENDLFERYGRQLILPSFGKSSQASLLSLKVLIIGCGGLGCPAATYLAGAGVGSITLVDDDVVSLSNLHRQVAHAESFAFGTPVLKAKSLASFLAGLNSTVNVKTICERFTAQNGLELAKEHDIILDASDNAASRYLINDAAVLTGKPLVSGAALGTDGQICVYNFNDGPCYRCVFPVAPHPSASRSCADAGVLGPIAGVIGSLQALEVLKIAAELARSRAKQVELQTLSTHDDKTSINGNNKLSTTGSVLPFCDNFSLAASALFERMVTLSHIPTLGVPLSGSLLIFDGSEARVRVAKLGKRRPECAICGTTPSITSLNESELWSSVSCLAERDDPMSTKKAIEMSFSKVVGENRKEMIEGAKTDADKNDDDIENVPNATLLEYNQENGQILLDVRSSTQFAISNISGALNIPLAILKSNLTQVNELSESFKLLLHSHQQTKPILCLCRRGNDSKSAARLLQSIGIKAVSIEGGIEAYLKSLGKVPY
jgi:molybdopterin/thiamine biosynthesis adenylyltransferase/rhodanese-related sulfurtransferase